MLKIHSYTHVPFEIQRTLVKHKIADERFSRMFLLRMFIAEYSASDTAIYLFLVILFKLYKKLRYCKQAGHSLKLSFTASERVKCLIVNIIMKEC